MHKPGRHRQHTQSNDQNAKADLSPQANQSSQLSQKREPNQATPPSTVHDNTPFNLHNKLLSEDDANVILREYNPDVSVGDVNLYRKAMTHRSYCTRKNENFIEGNVLCPPSCIPLQEESNERLEFLGDAVLNLVVGGYLFERFPDDNEGFLTRMRTKLVNGGMLASLCSISGLAQWFIISRQIDEAGGRSNKKVMEDVFEAYLGALYVDHGFQAAQTWIVSFIEKHVDFTDLIRQQGNHKDSLARYFQHAFHCLPSYTELHTKANSNSSTNDAHATVTVCIRNKQGTVIAMAKAANKKAAEAEAARKALLFYGQLSQADCEL